MMKILKVAFYKLKSEYYYHLSKEIEFEVESKHFDYHLNKNESLYFCYLQKKMENKEKSYENQRIHNGIRCR